ncbi:MAG: hypothetical protein QXM31_03025 [Candidatus Woesearchaeota archaeon]
MAFELLGVVMAIVGLFVGALFLWLSAAKIFRLKDKTFKTPLIISVIVSVVSYVLGLIPAISKWITLIVVIVLAVWLVKSRYNVGWGKAILVWLVYYVLLLVAMAIIGMIFIGSALAGAGVLSALG